MLRGNHFYFDTVLTHVGVNQFDNPNIFGFSQKVRIIIFDFLELMWLAKNSEFIWGKTFLWLYLYYVFKIRS